ncbi:MAG: hypothetical protein V3T49_05805 [Dehalococcoidia bacterium]
MDKCDVTGVQTEIDGVLWGIEVGANISDPPITSGSATSVPLGCNRDDGVGD